MNPNEPEKITDYFGNPIGWKIKEGDKTKVTDYFGNPKGYSSDKGTKDYFGNPISNQDVPDILFDEEDID